METKFNFSKMDLKEFEKYISNLRVGRTIITLQQHHTFSPDYALFNGSNHFDLQNGMKNYHIHNNGWSDIGQHFTIFPDGMILTGRSLEMSPACIFGQNQQAVCIENLGNFDKGKDVMTDKQKNSIIGATAILCRKFSIPVNTDKIVYHHWFRLDTGVRNNGAGGNKTCPGTTFFGGNMVPDCQKNFLPLVQKALEGENETNGTQPVKYVSVSATSLNVRTKPNGLAPKALDRFPVLFGSVLRVYAEKNGWYKISSSANHWIYGIYTVEVKRKIVQADILNVRNHPGATSLKIGSLKKGAEVFVYEEKNGWARVGISDQWVSDKYLL